MRRKWLVTGPVCWGIDRPRNTKDFARFNVFDVFDPISDAT